MQFLFLNDDNVPYLYYNRIYLIDDFELHMDQETCRIIQNKLYRK